MRFLPSSRITASKESFWDETKARVNQALSKTNTKVRVNEAPSQAIMQVAEDHCVAYVINAQLIESCLLS